MRKYILVTLLILIVGVALSFLLIPGDEEIVEMKVRDKELRTAGYTDYEEEYSKGNRTPEIMIGLANTYIGEGRGQEAIQPLETYLIEYPQETDVRRKLADLYQADERYDDFLREMEIVAKEDPSESNLKTLADIYNYKEMYDEQIEVLERLIEMTNGENPEYYVDLATVLDIQGREEEAVEIVKLIQDKYPDYMSFKLVRLLVTHYTGTCRGEEAFRIANDWVRANPNPQEVADLANILNFDGGRPDQALQLTTMHRHLIQQEEVVFIAHVNALVGDDKRSEAYQLVSQRYQQDRLPIELYAVFIELAIEFEDEEDAYKLADTLDPNEFGEDRAIALIEFARTQDGEEYDIVLEKLIKRFDRDVYLADKPVLDAIIALIRRDDDEDEKVQIALNHDREDITRYQELRLAAACDRAGKRQCFDQLVRRWEPLREQSPRELNEIVMVYIEVDRPNDIYDEVAGIYEDDPKEKIGVAWAKLATALNKREEITAWLNRSELCLTAQDLSTLFYIANDRRHKQLGMMYAEMLIDRKDSDRNRKILMTAYMTAGEYEKALPYLREKRFDSRADEDNYLLALSKLAKQDEALNDELVDHVVSQLNTEGLDKERRLQYVFMLINAGHKKKALPYINQYAKDEGGEWKKMQRQLSARSTGGGRRSSGGGTYVARAGGIRSSYPALREPVNPFNTRNIMYREPGSGLANPAFFGPDQPALEDLPMQKRMQLAFDRSTDEETRRFIAFSLKDDGYIAESTQVFELLAEKKGPQSKEVQDLLFMWNPPLDQRQMNWLLTRAEATQGAAKAAWIEHIAVHSDAYLLSQYLNAHSGAVADGLIKSRYLNQDTKETIADLPEQIRLRVASDPTLSDEERRQIAFSLKDEGLHQEATMVFELLARDKGPNSKEVQDLLFMWQPPLDQPKIDWLLERAHATQGQARLAWVEHIAVHSDPTLLTQYLTYQPGPVADSIIQAKYLDPTSPASVSDLPLHIRMRMAFDPNTSEDTRRNIAFGLLDDGYKADATLVFEYLAENKGPTSQEVKDLLFLWGPRLNEEQIAWVAARADASQGLTRAKWMEHITGMADDYALMRFVSQRPQTLSDATIRDRYFRALASHGSLDEFDEGMQPWVNTTNDINALRDYFKVAEANSMNDAAVHSLRRLDHLIPGQEVIIRDLAIHTYNQGDYSESAKYLRRYFQMRNQIANARTSDYEPHFYMGSLLLRSGNELAARKHFNEVIKRGPSYAKTVDKQSMYYTSLFQAGYHDTAKQGFYTLMNAYPENKSVLADFLSSLLEYKYYDEATVVANTYDQSARYYAQNNAYPMTIDSPYVANVQTYEGGREMQVRFSQPVGESVYVNPQQYPWLETQQVGYDSLHVAAKPGYTLQFAPMSEHSVNIVPLPDVVTPQQALKAREDLRLQLLYARLELETGRENKALNRLYTLEDHYPADPQVLGYTANAENYAGNWPRALSLLEQAQNMAPYNEDYMLLSDDIKQYNASHITLDHEWRRIGDSDEQITSVMGAMRLTDNVEVGFDVKNNELDASQLRRASTGIIQDFSLGRQKGEVYAAYYFDNGSRLKAAGFANNDTAGGGLYYAFTNPLGRSEIVAEYRKPYWNFVEAVAEHATRNRIGVRHFTNLRPDTSVSADVAYNQYNIEGDAKVADTAHIQANIVHRVRDENPSVAVGYGFDGEYIIDKEYRPIQDGSGDIYSPFPLTSREIHFVSGIFQQDFSESTRGQLVAGYAYDRLGGHGPQVEGRLTQEITDKFEAQIRGRYGLQTNETDNNVTVLGGHLKYKF